ncbi:MAG: cytochrome c553 [Rhodothermales bacterium]|jgi:cytochrome c553
MDEHEYGKPIFKPAQMKPVLVAFWAFTALLTLAIVVGSANLLNKAKHPPEHTHVTTDEPVDEAAAAAQAAADAAAEEAAAAVAAQGKTLYDANCASCHGEAGDGNKEKGAPVLPHLQEFYINSQISKLQEGIRGGHADDAEAKTCQAALTNLASDEDIETVVAHILSLPKGPAPAATITGGDAARGKSLYMTCFACHGADGKGAPAMANMSGASMVGQADWYLQGQIAKFKAKIRGSNPQDIAGMAMGAGVGSFLADEQAEKDVIAYIMTLK